MTETEISHRWSARRVVDSKTRAHVGFAMRHFVGAGSGDGEVTMLVESFDGTIREKAPPTRVVLRTYARDALIPMPGREDRDIILEVTE